MRFVVSCLICLVASGATAANAETPSAEEAAVRKVLDEQVAAWNRGDLPGFMAGYWKSNDLTYFSGKERQQGWDAALARWVRRARRAHGELGQQT